MTHTNPNAGRYSIGELAEAADLFSRQSDRDGKKEQRAARTVRSLIAAEALPPPNGKGRSAYYDDRHLERLKFFVTFREQFGGSVSHHAFAGIIKEALAQDPECVKRVASGEEELSVVVMPVASKFGAPEQVSMSQPTVAPTAQGPATPPQPARERESGPWTTIEINEDVYLRMRGDNPDRVASLARMARKLREWTEKEIETER